MNYKELADKVRYYKETEEGAKEMCDIWDDVRNEGIRKGKKEGKIEVAKELIKNGKLSLEDIAASIGTGIFLTPRSFSFNRLYKVSTNSLRLRSLRSSFFTRVFAPFPHSNSKYTYCGLKECQITLT